MIILGIETSCDETAVALVNNKKEILAHKVWSQTKHKKFGGVVPEIAAREHLKRLPYLIKSIMNKANIALEDITAVAATAGPGMIGGIIVGVMVAKSLSISIGKPFLAINHLVAHALTARLTSNLSFPYLLLLTSGGHCQLLLTNSSNDFKLLGNTLDDSAGETFDKVARNLGLSYPGGPEIERIAKKGNENKFTLPKPLFKKKGQMNFSFSGLKTATIKCIANNIPLTKQTRADIAASLQKTIADLFYYTTNNTLSYLSKRSIKINALVIAGGVAANKKIRSKLKKLAQKHSLRLICPPINLCTDNGVMIAWAGVEKLIISPGSKDITFNPRSRWSLEEN